MNKLDVERIKKDISVEDLIGQSYQVIGTGHTLKTKEHDSLKIYTNDNSWYWFSKSIGGDVISWYMHVHGCSFKSAASELIDSQNGGNLKPRPMPVNATQSQVPTVEAWQDAKVQMDYRRTVDEAVDRLHFAPEAQEARDYLLGRGIRSDIWIAYDLGFAVVNNPNVKKKMSAIVIPWQRDKITGIEFRFLTDDKKIRFSSWGKRYLFGLNRLSAKNYRTDNVRQGTSNTVLFVEGPLNAISVYQEAYGSLGFDVVSFGSQGRATSEQVAGIIKAVASKYKYQIIWADEANVSLSAAAVLPSALIIKSPAIDGGETDANDMLKGGYLYEFLYLAAKDGRMENTE